ncbi:hypothetical protein BDZ97DRAFT_2053496 [Flammula alnicola]|nr:hypothetical protein BDZ97DRAFT_2053496 [Flammula alnicola]
MASETPKLSNASTENKDSKAIPTPPSTETSEEKILQPEFEALTRCLKDAVVKTGQIYNFYAATRKLGIEKHIPNPPQSLTAALGRDVEKYDQLCDSIEAHLATMDTSATQPPSDGGSTNPRNSPVLNTALGRRPSAISISSLHRPQFPLKLDLSSTSLRITEEEAALYSKGLASPVTLAPKSARPVGPNEFPPDLMAAFASSSLPLDGTHGPTEIDLTLPDEMHMPHKESDLAALGVGLGDSSDKPIELDLDAMDIDMSNVADPFGNPAESGESSNPHDGLFSPLLDDGEGEQLQNNETDNQPLKEGDALNNFNITSPATDELFGDFTSSGDLGVDMDASGSMLQSQSNSVPSPGSLLAQFSAASDLMDVKPSPSDDPSMHGTGEAFDDLNSIDLNNLPSGFFSNPQDSEVGFSMDMEAFLNSGNVLNMDSIVDQKAETGTGKS